MGEKIHSKSTLYVLIVIIALTLSACSDGCGMNISERLRLRDLKDSPRVRTCRDTFYYGPLWEQVDRVKAYHESEWIVQVWTGKRSHLVEETYNAESGDYAFDYSQEILKLESILETHNVEILSNQKDWALVLKGTPEHILDVLEESCQLQAFDLTGFHCDCAPQMCAQASSCDLVYHYYTKSFGISKAWILWETQEVVPQYQSTAVMTCTDDYDDQYMAPTMSVRTDLRGFEWPYDTSSRVNSWKTSPCEAQQ